MSSILPLPAFTSWPLLCNLFLHKYPCLWCPSIAMTLYQPSCCVLHNLIFATSSEECSAWTWLIFAFKALCGILCFEFSSCIFNLYWHNTSLRLWLLVRTCMYVYMCYSIDLYIIVIYAFMYLNFANIIVSNCQYSKIYWPRVCYNS